uniref:Uncharacterized protein n=1 Tax=Castor canadensis TaxID=51338 RepID=A0A8C0XTQ0_CASCN|nr:coiled-coil domain-containing protein 96 [Castor canadensis]
MDDHSQHDEVEGGNGESLDPTKIEVSSVPQTLVEPEGPELELEQEPKPKPGPETVAAEEGPELEARESGADADQQAETLERPETTEAAGEDEPGEPKRRADLQPEGPAEPPSEDGSEEPETEEVEVMKRRKMESCSRSSAKLTTISKEEAAPVLEAERAKGKEEEDDGEEGASEESQGEMEGAEGRKWRSQEERRPSGGDPGQDEEWSEEVQKEQEQQLRSELLEQYHSLMAERNRYRRYNLFLQHKIFEALRKKKGLEAGEAPDGGAEPEDPEREQAYLHRLAILEELKKQEADDLEWYHQELGQLKQQCQEKLARVEKEWRRFQALKKQVVMQVVGSCRMRGGRQAALREVEQIQALEDKKEKEMSVVRLENVQLRQSLVHFETRMRAQEDLAEGLLLIDFEQLKIENQTFNEKVEERNEELLKLRNKVTNNVQTITHIKEKLHFIDTENACKKTQLLEIEAQVSLGRDVLRKTKQARDSLRVDNMKLNQKCGLLGKEALLRDLEEKVDKTNALNKRLESLKRHHAGLTLSCRGVKQKIREAKAFLPS